MGAPQPLCWAGEVYLIYPARSADPGSFCPSTAAAVGDRGAWRHTAVPCRSPRTPAEACWIRPPESDPGTSSPSLSSAPVLVSCLGRFEKDSFFFAVTISIWKIKDIAAPCKLYSLQLAKPLCDDRNTHYLQRQVSDWAIP